MRVYIYINYIQLVIRKLLRQVVDNARIYNIFQTCLFSQNPFKKTGFLE